MTATCLDGCRTRPAAVLSVPLLAFFAWLWLAASAFAHASLVETSPADGAVLADPPAAFSITFSEPVSPLSLTLVKPDGSSLTLDRFKLRDRTIEIEAPADLTGGMHVLSWRIVSEDGHPVGGSVVFSIGAASGEKSAFEKGADWTVRSGLLGGKIALYVGLFIGTGGAFAMSWLLRGARPGRGLVFIALGIGAMGAVLAAGFQGLDALGTQVGHIFEPVVWTTAMATSFGPSVIVAAAALACAAAAMVWRKGSFSRISSLVALLLVGATLATTGHASTADPQWLMRPMVFLHGAAIAFWTGALVPLGLALKRGDPGAAAGLRWFSAIIPYAIALLIVAGLAMAVVQIQRPAALLDTAYGRVFLVKLGLLAGLFGLAAANRWTFTARAKAGDAAATRRLVRSIAAETGVVLLIFAVAACWRFTPPPRALAIAAARPATEHIHSETAQAFIEVMPGRAGEVDVSINIFDGEFRGLDAKEVTFVLAKPDSGIEPFKRPMVRRGQANWRVEDLKIPLAGAWRVRVEILVTDFDIARLEGQITIRPGG